jgi:serine/threonine protein kinase
VEESLESKIKEGYIDEASSVYYMRQILTGLRALFKFKVLHRDIKPSNILLDANHCVKLSDFSEAISGQTEMKDKVGSPEFQAPEVLEIDPEKGYNKKCDIWSLGVTFYNMLYGRLPWSSTTDEIERLIHEVKNCSGSNLYIPREPKINPMIVDLLKRMICPNQEDRIRWKELFNHEIFRSIDIKNISFISSSSDAMLNFLNNEREFSNELSCINSNSEKTTPSHHGSLGFENFSSPGMSNIQLEAVVSSLKNNPKGIEGIDMIRISSEKVALTQDQVMFYPSSTGDSSIESNLKMLTQGRKSLKNLPSNNAIAQLSIPNPYSTGNPPQSSNETSRSLTHQASTTETPGHHPAQNAQPSENQGLVCNRPAPLRLIPPPPLPVPLFDHHLLSCLAAACKMAFTLDENEKIGNPLRKLIRVLTLRLANVILGVQNVVIGHGGEDIVKDRTAYTKLCEYMVFDRQGLHRDIVDYAYYLVREDGGEWVGEDGRIEGPLGEENREKILETARAILPHIPSPPLSTPVQYILSQSLFTVFALTDPIPSLPSPQSPWTHMDIYGEDWNNQNRDMCSHMVEEGMRLIREQN